MSECAKCSLEVPVDVRYGIAADKPAGVVHIHFNGLPLSWLNLKPAEARTFALALLGKAGEIDGEKAVVPG